MNIKSWLKNKKIGVLYGGNSAEREISLKSGKAVLEALKGLKLNSIGIDVNSDLPEVLKKSKIDFAYIALHGPLGEDGTVQGLLQMMGIPYSGCGVLSSAISMDKVYSKMVFDSCGIPTPRWETADRRSKPGSFSKYPVVVKPVSQGSAIGISIAERKRDLEKAVKKALKFDSRVLIEEYVRGTEITVGILGGKALPVIEIVPANKFYDFESKYSLGKSDHIIPARLPEKVLRETQSLALKVFKSLSCRAVARVDIIVDKKNRPWVLEINTIPGMTETSLLPDAARSAGMDFRELVLKIIEFSITA